MEVGELDIFRDEDIEYARRVADVGISVELHVHPGCPHGFDRVSGAAAVVRRSRADRLRVLNSSETGAHGTTEQGTVEELPRSVPDDKDFYPERSVAPARGQG
jgi:acetyl esterase/lipase